MTVRQWETENRIAGPPDLAAYLASFVLLVYMQTLPYCSAVASENQGPLGKCAGLPIHRPWAAVRIASDPDAPWVSVASGRPISTCPPATSKKICRNNINTRPDCTPSYIAIAENAVTAPRVIGPLAGVVAIVWKGFVHGVPGDLVAIHESPASSAGATIWPTRPVGAAGGVL